MINYQQKQEFIKTIGAWVEEEILNLNTFYYPDISTNINASQFTGIRQSNAQKQIDNIIDIGLIYKKLSPVFRWVANSIVSSRLGAVHCQPIYKDKIRICDAIASFLDVLPRFMPNKFGIFKSPLKILIETVYGLNYNFAYDEISLLFALLCESMGIATIVILSEMTNKIQIGCKTVTVYSDENEREEDYYKNYTVYDFSKGHPFQKATLNYLQKNIISEFDVQKDISVDINEVEATPIVSFIGKGIAYRNETKYWNDFRLQPNVNRNWFKQLINSRIDYMNENFGFFPTVDKRNEKMVTYNTGVEATGSIIALFANYIANKYDVIRNYVINDVIANNYKASNSYSNLGSGNINSIMNVLEAIFKHIRYNFKYCEETIGVEQIASPLNILYVEAFHPFIQKYDCDDLTLLFLTLAESINYKNKYGRKLFDLKARLGGSKHDRNKVKYHVYPVVNINGKEIVHDVSIVDTIGWEMNRGDNYQDFEVNHPEKYQRYLKNKINNNLIIF